MHNYINYYYEMYPDKIEEVDNKYVFILNNEKYYFIMYDRDINELDTIVRLNQEMISRNSLVHEIILNKDAKAITLVDGKYYSLLRVYVNEKEKIKLEDIIFMSNNNDGILPNNVIGRINWDTLWEAKIDYFEYQISHLMKSYPYIYKTVDYYIGLGENSISYVKNLRKEEGLVSILSVSHKRVGVNSTLFDLYNPFNLIIDYKVRDIGEYIKDAFFNDYDVKMLLNKIFSIYKFDKITLELLFSRLLFPSYYFDLYENIVVNELNENLIQNIIKKSSKYEDFLIMFMSSTNITKVDWLNRIIM